MRPTENDLQADATLTGGATCGTLRPLARWLASDGRAVRAAGRRLSRSFGAFCATAPGESPRCGGRRPGSNGASLRAAVGPRRGFPGWPLPLPVRGERVHRPVAKASGRRATRQTATRQAVCGGRDLCPGTVTGGNRFHGGRMSSRRVFLGSTSRATSGSDSIAGLRRVAPA